MPTLTERFVADIEGLSDLPSLSPVLAHLIATLGREDASVAEVAAIIRQDPVSAARVRGPGGAARLALVDAGCDHVRPPCSPSLRPGATGAPVERGHHSPGGSPR